MGHLLTRLGRAVFALAIVFALAFGAREVFASSGSNLSCDNCQNDDECVEDCCGGAAGSICPVPNVGAFCLCA